MWFDTDNLIICISCGSWIGRVPVFAFSHAGFWLQVLLGHHIQSMEWYWLVHI